MNCQITILGRENNKTWSDALRLMNFQIAQLPLALLG